jgi:hypothetical protein
VTKPTQTVESTAAVGRDIEGKFLPGMSGNPNGRPPTVRENIARLKQTIEEAVRAKIPAERVVKVIENLIKQAEKGNTKAATAILPYFLSKPDANDETGTERPTIVIKVENATFKATKEKDTHTAIEAEFTEVKQNG